MERAKTFSMAKILPNVIISVQSFDILVHFLADDLEFLRVLSNIAIFLSVRFFTKHNKVVVYVGGLSLYLLLNVIFLFTVGLYNDGSLRIVLFVLLVITAVLMGTLTRLVLKKIGEKGKTD